MPKATVEEVLAFLPADGSEMDYTAFEQAVVASNLDSPRDALRVIVVEKRANLQVRQVKDSSGKHAGVVLKVWKK